ncbi:MAG: UDP-3-O-acyl-N-acetylglucosamine deacetylase [Armatimonadota bacterium]|nr:UDP-3-O-acyl-N-acetylglucosamine deacetylase [Armatimonadota bacterium]
MASDGARPRRTPAGPTDALAGIGLHSGAETTVRLRPAPPGAGLVFRDAQSGQEIPALAANVSDTSRCTIVSGNGVSVQTVEHLLSALAALGVDDAVIEISGGEMPAGDGSAAPFVALIQSVGLRDQDGPPMEPLVLTRPYLLEGENGSSVVALPASSFRATVVLDYPGHPWIGTQVVTFDAGEGDYAADIAPARTFGFLREIDWLQSRGLALGASRDNGIALREDGYDTPLRFPDEMARHKLLDLIGDLALVGRPVQAHFFAIKPSHALNTRLARRLADDP